MFESDCYWLFDNKDRRYVAYCDLSSEPGSAWTLVMSWDRTNKNLPQFQRKTFLEDAPINHNTPNWNSFRQTLERMKNIRSRSSPLVGSGLLDLDYTLWIQDSRYLVSGTWNLGLQLLVGSRFLDLYSRFQCPGFLIIHRAFRIPGTGV